MKNTEPHTEVGDSIGHRDEENKPLTKLARIAAKARDNPKEQFNNLLHHLSEQFIAQCLSQISWRSASGTDGMSREQAEKNLSWLLPPIMEQIHEGRYAAPAVRRVYIPKADGSKRPIGIPQVVDRAVQAATAQILGEIYEQDFLTCSYGFRPKTGCHHALASIEKLLSGGKMNHVLEVDIRDFFGSISHEWLMKFLALRISDKRILKLIQNWLRAGVMEDGRIKESTQVGTPQGGSISPLLANIYLHYVLDLWFEKKIRKQMRGQARLIRYADDFVILFERVEDLQEFEALLRSRLGQFGLEIADKKTHRTNLTPRKNQGGERRRLTFLGFNIYRAVNRKHNGYKVIFQTESKRFTRAKATLKETLKIIMHWELKDQVKRINATLTGHYNYYGMAGNMRRLQSFYWETVQHWRKCLSRRSQHGKVNWTQMRQILQTYRLKGPRIHIPYGALAMYVKL